MEEYDSDVCKCKDGSCGTGKPERYIDMGKNDVALVLRENLEQGGFIVEMSYPDYDLDSMVSGAVEFISAVGMRIVNDPDFIEEQYDYLKERLDSLEEMLGEQEVEVDLEEKPEE